MKSRIFNVASVPQRSPFRYPGGKTWFVPYARAWLCHLGAPVEELVEPFAGGAIVGLTAAFEGLANTVTLVELDPDISAVWEAILNGEAEWLASRIIEFKPSVGSVSAVLGSEPRSLHDRAFAALLRNRVQRGGIMAPGAGLMKFGENGRGLLSRWYPQTLGRRIREIASLAHRLRFVSGDGLSHIEENAPRPGLVYFIDPPYTVAGRRLYRYSDLDHEKLFSLADRIAGRFLMTYDDANDIRKLAARFEFATATVPMKNTHHERMRELLVGRDLEWLSRGVFASKFRSDPGFEFLEANGVTAG